MSLSPAGISDQQLAEVALTREEYDLACSRLGRQPTDVELGVIGAMWSEHCGYKTSKPLLARLPTAGERVLQGPGENAGVIDVGHGIGCAFKVESHNHPSAIEPYEGAATGVGGILRDIFTMGARPVALLDSLRFGPLDEPEQRRLFEGVVAGIGGYGNCIGVPTVGGEVYFEPAYRNNCLVNAMCVGIVDHARLMRARAAGIGNPILLVGADTGRDGIHGATFASVELDEASAARRPAVQVGNPFLEKCLMEACLELAGDERVVAIQDLGAAGLTSSISELAHRGGCGVDIDVAQVARRERGMTPYEVMLSESQERMLIVVRAGEEAGVQRVFERWELHSDVIGHLTDGGSLVVRDGGTVVCELPLAMLVDEVPLRHPEARRPAHLDEMLAQVPLAGVARPAAGELLLRLLASPNIGSRRPIFRRYDHQVGTNTVVLPGGDAAVVRVEGTPAGVALTTDGNARYAALDPKLGAAIAVCEAARNVVATGARPVGVTNCLNYGNPEKPEVFWELREGIEGLAEACEALGVPVVSGNVSLYNDSSGTSIWPTAVIGMVGVIEDVRSALGSGAGPDGSVIGLAGPLGSELGGSEVQSLLQGGANTGARPVLDLETERRVQGFVLAAHAAGLLASAHDCAEGGLMVALAETAIASGRGIVVDIPELSVHDPIQRIGILAGETQSRFVLSFSEGVAVELQTLAEQHKVEFRRLGIVGGDRLMCRSSGDPVFDVPLADAAAAYEGALVAS